MADPTGQQNEDENMWDDDPDLQLALALSMAQEQPDEGAAPQPQPLAAAAAAPPPAPAPQPHNAAHLNALALQQALQQALLQAMSGGAAVPAPQPQQQAAAAAAAAAEPAAESSAQMQAPVPTSPAPSWVLQVQCWASAAPADEGGVVVPTTASAALEQAVSKVLGLPVALVSGMGAAPKPGSIGLAVLSDPGGTRLTGTAVDASINRLQPGQNQILTYQAAWLRAAEAAVAPGLPAEVAAAVQLWQRRLAKKAAAILAADEDDLFFEGGRSRGAFLLAIEGGQVSPAFLDALVYCAASPQEAALWEGILKDSFAALRQFSFLHSDKAEAPLKRLDLLTQCTGIKRCLAALLVREAAAAGGTPPGAPAGSPPGKVLTGAAFEAGAVAAPLLAVSSLPRVLPTLLPLSFPAKECFMQLRSYPRNRGAQVEAEYTSIRRSLQRAYTASHEILKRLATLKAGPAAGPAGREVVSAWLAAALGTSAVRAEAGSYLDRVLHHRKAMRDGAGDGFMVGCLALLLRFCRPFISKPDKQQGALLHLSPSYYSRFRHRLARSDGVAGDRPLGSSAPAAEQDGVQPFPFLSADCSEAPHFVADCFFLTQRAIHVSLMPAVYKHQALAKLLARKNKEGGEEEECPLEEQAASVDQWVLHDSMRAQLLDPEFAADTVVFMELQARWLLWVMGQGDEAAALSAFALIPEHAVRDMAAWLSFLIHNQSTELLGGMDIGLLISCLTACLRRTDLIPSPAVAFSIVQLLYAMLSPQLDPRRLLGRGGAASLAARRVSPAEAALVTAVLGTGAAQTELLPALMRAYHHADHVVGLDVDKDQYDKFHLRSLVDALLMELWGDPACARSLTAVACQAGSADFPDFVGSVLNNLIYLLEDSLQRLQDIHRLERSKADAAAWEALPPAERSEKEQFYASQQSTSRGFMRMALSTLQMLITLVDNRAVHEAFMREDIVHKAATAAVKFIDLLQGPTCAQLQVERPEQYFFSPDQLLVQMLNFTLRLAEQPRFVAAVAAAPDYEESVMQSALDTLAAKQLGEYEHMRRLEALMAGVRQARHASAIPTPGTAGEAALDLSFSEPEAPNVEAAYVAALEPLAVDVFDSTAPRAYKREFAERAAQPAGDAPARAKALAREYRNFSSRTRLPIYAASSIFVRYDADHLDKARALITGPEGTPYYGGCFIFDVWFPPTYPDSPPLMELETTGGGVARFNPNLYADGKVCLSLLGTWHGGSSSEKWQPGKSNLFQVLLSLQGMIFIADPYFNEPAYDGMRATAEGASSSLKYNSDVWLSTIRYAMTEVLRKPRPGFEAVVTAHFRALRHRIMRQCTAWMEEAKPLNPLFQKRLREAVAELHAELAKL